MSERKNLSIEPSDDTRLARMEALLISMLESRVQMYQQMSETAKSIQSLASSLRAQANAIADLAESQTTDDNDDDEPQTLDGR